MILFLILHTFGFSSEAPKGAFQDLVECATQAGPGETPYTNFFPAQGNQPKTVIVPNTTGTKKEHQALYAIQANRAYTCKQSTSDDLNNHMKIKFSFDGQNSTNSIDAQMIDSKIQITHDSFNTDGVLTKFECKTSLDVNEQMPNLINEIKKGIGLIGEVELTQMETQEKDLHGLNYRKKIDDAGDSAKSSKTYNTGASQYQNEQHQKFSKTLDQAISRLQTCANTKPPSGASDSLKQAFDDLHATVEPQLTAMKKLYEASQSIVRKTVPSADQALPSSDTAR